MSGRRALLAALAAVVVLFGGSLAVIAWVTRLPPPPPAAPAEAVAAPASSPESRAEPARAPPPAVASAPASAALAIPVSPVRRPAPAPRPMGPALVARRITRGGLRGTAAPTDLLAGLDALHAQVAACGASAAQTPFARKQPTFLPASSGGRHLSRPGGSPVLLLELEPADGEVRIAKAPVQSPAGASDALLACAQAKVVGQVLQASGARAGTARISMPFELRFR